jgi:multidrug efflux pump subunit AcrA (membrane-fusion protein)
MKKIVVAFSMLLVMVFASCKKEVPPPPPPVPEPQVIVVPPPPPAPAKEVDKDGTTISVGSDGVEISTKEGDKKTVIDVKDGQGSIEIKK